MNEAISEITLPMMVKYVSHGYTFHEEGHDLYFQLLTTI